MDLSRFTEKSQEAVQAAQTLAARRGHVQVDGEWVKFVTVEGKRVKK